MNRCNEKITEDLRRDPVGSRVSLNEPIRAKLHLAQASRRQFLVQRPRGNHMNTSLARYAESRSTAPSRWRAPLGYPARPNHYCLAVPVPVRRRMHAAQCIHLKLTSRTLCKNPQSTIGNPSPDPVATIPQLHFPIPSS